MQGSASVVEGRQYVGHLSPVDCEIPDYVRNTKSQAAGQRWYFRGNTRMSDF